MIPNVTCHPEQTLAKDSCDLKNDVFETSHTSHKHSTAPNDPKSETASAEPQGNGELSYTEETEKVANNCNHIMHVPCVAGEIISISIDEEYKVNTCKGTVYRSWGDAPQTASLCWPTQCHEGDDPISHWVPWSTNLLFHSPHPDPGGPCTPGLLFEIYRKTEDGKVMTDFTVGIICWSGDKKIDEVSIIVSSIDLKENVEYATSADSVCNDSSWNRYDIYAEPHKEL